MPSSDVRVICTISSESLPIVLRLFRCSTRVIFGMTRISVTAYGYLVMYLLVISQQRVNSDFTIG